VPNSPRLIFSKKTLGLKEQMKNAEKLLKRMNCGQ
jgi:hypothetical protein